MKNKIIKIVIIGLIVHYIINKILSYFNYIPKHRLKYLFLKLKEIEGFDYKTCKRIEQIYKLETNNFKSEIFKNTNGAGAIATKMDYPYGFNRNLYGLLGRFITEGLYKSINGNYYIKFRTLYGGLYFLGNYIKKYNYLRWYSANVIQQGIYLEKLNKINTEISNEIFNK